MPSITDPHKDYQKRLKQWKRCRDAAEGQDAIKSAKGKQGQAGEVYLKRLPGMKTEEYQLYLERAFWFNATGRTIKGLNGMLHRKPVVVQGIPKEDAIVRDMDLAGTSLEEFAKNITDEVITVGRIGVLVDLPKIEGAISVREAERVGVRPYCAIYMAEDIITWSEALVAGRRDLTRVVLREDGAKGFYQYRELKLDAVREEGMDPVLGCVVIVWTKEDENAEYKPSPPVVIRNSEGSPAPRIPFWFNPRAKADVPPLLDLVDLNISHYQTMADLEALRLLSGRATLTLVGDFNPPDPTKGNEGGGGKIKIGTSAVLQAQETGSSATITYLPADALVGLEKADEQKRLMMARVGSRVLQDDPAGVEAFRTVLLRANGENSVLAGIAVGSSRMLSEILTYMTELRGTPATVTVTLNTEFFPEPLDAGVLTAVVAAWLEGTVVDDDLYLRWKAMGLVSDGTTLETFKAALAKAKSVKAEATKKGDLKT